MQRWVTTLIGLAVALLPLWLVVRNFQAPKAIGRDPALLSGDAGSEHAATFAAPSPDAGLAAGSEDGGPLLLTDLLGSPLRADGGFAGAMPDGTPVPLLPFSAPRQVRFGVVLVTYAGAQPGPGSPHPSSRPKEEAHELADKLRAGAEKDFHAAVQQGDPGSSDDVGHVKLGILEPAPEYILFTLPVDGVGGPIETPRGYWVVKRLE